MKVAENIVCLHSRQKEDRTPRLGLTPRQRSNKQFIMTKPLAVSCCSHKLPSRSKTNAKHQRFPCGKSALKKGLEVSHLFSRCSYFSSSLKAGNVHSAIDGYYTKLQVRYYFWAISAQEAAVLPSRDVPLSDMTFQPSGNACCQHMLSSLMSDKVLILKFTCYLTHPQLQVPTEHILELLKQFIAVIKVMCLS